MADEADQVGQVAPFRISISLGLHLRGAGSSQLELADPRIR